MTAAQMQPAFLLKEDALETSLCTSQSRYQGSEHQMCDLTDRD